MIGIFTKQVCMNSRGGKVEFTLRPLTGEHYAVFMEVIGRLGSLEGADNKELLKNLDRDTVKKLHFVVLESLKRSLPDEKVETLDEFASQNLFELIDHVADVNVGTRDAGRT